MKGEVKHNPDQEPRTGQLLSKVRLREADRHSRADHGPRVRSKANGLPSRGLAHNHKVRLRAAGLLSRAAVARNSRRKVSAKETGLLSSRDVRSHKARTKAAGLPSSQAGVHRSRAEHVLRGRIKANVPSNKGDARIHKDRIKVAGLPSNRGDARSRKGRVKAVGLRMAVRRIIVPNQDPRTGEPVSLDHRKRANRLLVHGPKNRPPTTKALPAGASRRQLSNLASPLPKRPRTAAMPTVSARVSPSGITVGRKRDPNINVRKKRLSCRRRKSSSLRLPSRLGN